MHEAAHVAAAVFHRRRVEHVQLTVGFTEVGEELGHARIPIDERIEPSQIVIALVGYATDGTRDWPPPYAKAREEELESLGTVIRLLDIDDEQYAQLVELTHDLLTNEHFIRLRDSIARALSAVPRLEREDVEALCHVHGFPIPEREEQPCNT